MKNAKNNMFSSIIIPMLLIGGIVAVSVVGWNLGFRAPPDATQNFKYTETNFGSYLAMRHAIWVDDFDSVSKFSDALSDVEIKSVQSDLALGRFISGRFDDSAKIFENDKSAPARVAYASYLIRHDDWAQVYKLTQKDDSMIMSPLRIWSAVAVHKESEALKFIDAAPADESWKLFMRGMVYAETDRPDKAKALFDKVPLDFFNLNDYLYMLSFYKTRGFDQAAEDLKSDFAASPGGAYVGDYYETEIDQTGVKNALVFSLVQNISHSPALLYTNVGILMTRLAESVQTPANDAVNYYLGLSFYNSGSPKYGEYFEKVDSKSPYYAFVVLKNAEKAGNFEKMRGQLEAELNKNPTFLPALNKLVAINLQKGRENDALNVVNKALKQPGLSNYTQADLLKTRTLVYLRKNDLKKAQDDIIHAGDLAPNNPEVLTMTARVWAARKENLDMAYDYAMGVIEKFPGEVSPWDALAMVVWAREGVKPAAEVLERVGRVADENSALFEHLGDARAAQGDNKGAAAAYQKALKLSGDGLSSEPELQNKIKKLKF